MRNYLFDRPVGGLPNQPAPQVTPALRRQQLKQAKRRLKKSYRVKKKQLRREMRKVRRSPLPWLLAFFVALALLCGAAVAIHYWARDVFPDFPSDSDSDGDSADGSLWQDLFTGSETTIPRAPIGGTATLTLQDPSTEPLTPTQIYQKALPSVVLVECSGTAAGSSGSGIIMTSDGYVLTNYHVVEGMSQCWVCLLTDGTEYEAQLVGYYEDKDLAVLKVDAVGLTPAEFGSSRALQVGDPVYALGNPLGYLYGTFTDGMVSALDRVVTVGDYQMTLIQTNVALNSGNSGGALLNQYGQVVGITSAKITSTGGEVTVEGMGLAIPISDVRGCVNSIIANGEVITPRIGIMAKVSVFKNQTGVLVISVDAGSPAEAAGLLADDFILAADGIPVTTVEELKEVFYDAGVGGTVLLTVLRGLETVELSVTLTA